MLKPENPFTNPESFMNKRRKELVALATVAILSAGGIYYEAWSPGKDTLTKATLSQSHEQKQPDKFLNQLGQSLIDLHEDSNGGWRFKSAIQAPHYQTDRDVGAAGVGMGFLALSKANPQDSRWIDGAKQTAVWLMAVSKKDSNGGRYWPDYVDDNYTSGDVYSSFDDGTIGIGDFFWQLYEKTNDPKYKQVAIGSVKWTLSQAEPYNSVYRWKWNATDASSPFYMGMGEGQAGIVYALSMFSERLQPTDPVLAAKCKAYAEGGLNYIKSVRQGLDSQTVPETGVIGQDGDTTLDSGYLSGAAGQAFMYLNLYKLYDDKKYLDEANTILNWLGDTENGPMVKTGNDSVAWKLALDPQAEDDNHYATGVEEGNAGIGWTYLQAYNLTGNKEYLRTAQSAGNWLLDVAIKNPDGGISWHEDENPANPLVHANLNNGAAGVGMFLQDLYQATGNQKYGSGATGAIQWLKSSAKFSGNDIYWRYNGGEESYSNDPSWHWGLAGIIEFYQRYNGGAQDILGEQPGLL